MCVGVCVLGLDYFEIRRSLCLCSGFNNFQWKWPSMQFENKVSARCTLPMIIWLVKVLSIS